MVTRRLLAAVFLAALMLVGVNAFAQTTATLTGTVTSGGSPLPGATVSVASPALQGVRTTVSGPNGDYTVQALPPGRYTVTFELEGLTKVTQTVDLRLAETGRADADLKASKVSEAITVTASAPSVLETPQVSTSLTREQVEALPIGRTIAQRIQLAPGVNNAGPNNQTIVNGAPSYDNLYLVNGVVVNDSIRGQPENLFIEDAIQETTLLTGGVSAEYGRFTGGVISTITKSGGNEFSGTLRDSLTNDDWQKLTAFKDPIAKNPDGTPVTQPPNTDKVNHQYEGTLGGYFLKDRLWFFGAGRKFNQSISRVTTATNIPFVNQLNNKRYEIKLTGQITAKHSLVGSYLHNVTDETNNRFGTIVDLRSLSNRQLPNWLEDYHYSGVITNSLLVEAMYSRRYFAFIGGGGPKDLIQGTLMRDLATAQRAWSPTFCGECDPKTRNNKDYLGKVNYFISTKSMGSHNIVGGYDAFHELRHENNEQSGSGYRIWGDFVIDGQNVYFHTNPTRGFVQFTPIAQSSLTSDVATKSFFANDKWDFNNHLSFNVGLRWDKNDVIDQTHNKIADDSAISPRLGIIYDIRGDGRDRVSGSYAKYASKIDTGISDTVSVAGNPASIYYNYRGPEYNAVDPVTKKIIGTPIPTDQVIKNVFDWFNSVGGANGYKDIAAIGVPGLTEKLAGGLKSPNMQEIAVGYGHQIGSSGYARVDYINRDWKDFYTIFRNLSTGQNVTPSGSKVDVGLIDNASNDLSRKYHGLQTQAAYRIGRLNLGGNYTWSKLRGNVEGETFNNATIFAGVFNQYPEYRGFAQNEPVGFLNEDIRHRANLFGNYDIALPWGNLNLGVLERYHSGAPYSAIGNARLVGVITNPGYAVPPTNAQYFFSERGGFRLDSIKETSLNATYNLPTFGRVNVFLRADVINIFNEQGVEFAQTALGSVLETRVYTAQNAPRATLSAARGERPNAFAVFNPYTATPIQWKPGMDVAGTYNFMLDPTFGQPTNKDAYQTPRTYRFAIGLRF